MLYKHFDEFTDYEKNCSEWEQFLLSRYSTDRRYNKYQHLQDDKEWRNDS